MVGTVTVREEKNYSSIDVDLADKQKYRNLVFNDDYQAQICALNYSGLVLCSKVDEQDINQYDENDDFIADDDEMEIEDEVKKAEKERKKRMRYAHIYYKPFSTYKSLNDWHY